VPKHVGVYGYHVSRIAFVRLYNYWIKFSRPGYVAPGVCTSLQYSLVAPDFGQKRMARKLL
jgi:hypothetical protein